MAEDEGRPAEDETEDEGAEDDGTEGAGDTEDDAKPEDEDPATLKADRDKAIKRRDAALKRARAMEAELAKIKGKGEDEPDPVAVATARLVRSETRTQLAAAGVEDRDAQDEVLGILDLSGITVDARGDVDPEVVADMIETLRRVFGVPAKTRTPRTRVDTRDRGGSGRQSDPDKERWARIMGQRR